MTSNISLSSLCKENLKHRTAMILITCFYFLVQILIFVMSIQNTLEDDEILAADIPKQITALALPNEFFLIAAIVLAILSAFISFKFLHSKTQTDFYGSLPVKRSTIFAANFIDDLVIFAIPMGISTVIEGLVMSAMGYGSTTMVHNLFASFVVMLVGFLLTWATAALAMILTGHSFIALLGFGVFTVYAPLVLRFLIPSYAETFFKTYVLSESGSGLNYFSPVSLTYLLYGRDGVNEIGWLFSGHIKHLIAALVFFLVVGGLAYFLYLRRPAESAGNAMAFPKANSIIRILIVIPMALYSGFYFSELSLQKSTTWLFVGIVLGVFIFHAIIECIFEFDIHALFHHKKQLLLSGAFCIVFAICFLFDVFGYDHYLPKRANIHDFTLTIDDYWQPSYDSMDDFFLSRDGLSASNTDKALSMIRNCQDDTAADVANTLDEQEISSIDKSYLTVKISYKSKSGTLHQRQFVLNRKKCMSYLDSLYATEDLKNDVYPLYQLKNIVKGVTYSPNGSYEKALNLSKKELKEFVDIYLSELTSTTYSYEENTTAVAQISFSFKDGPNSQYYDDSATSTYYIYPSFTKTKAFLAKKNITVPEDATHIFDNTGDNTDIRTLYITEYDTDDDDYREVAAYKITDKKVIDAYKSKLVPNAFSRTSLPEEYDITATLKGNDSDDPTEDDSITCYTDTKTIKELISHAEKISTSSEDY